MSVVYSPRPDFPDTIVRLIPEFTDSFSKSDNEIACFPVEPGNVRRDVMYGIQDLAVDIELKLLFCSIPDPDWFGIAITRKPIEYLFFQRRFAVYRIEDLQ